jgi:hypothetical protein
MRCSFLDPRIFEAVELSDGSIRVVMEISVPAGSFVRVRAKGALVQVVVLCGRRVHWDGVFHLPFRASEDTIRCRLSNSFLELVAGPAGLSVPRER